MSKNIIKWAERIKRTKNLEYLSEELYDIKQAFFSKKITKKEYDYLGNAYIFAGETIEENR